VNYNLGVEREDVSDDNGSRDQDHHMHDGNVLDQVFGLAQHRRKRAHKIADSGQQLWRNYGKIFQNFFTNFSFHD
jgi:hypothetical protein